MVPDLETPFAIVYVSVDGTETPDVAHWIGSHNGCVEFEAGGRVRLFKPAGDPTRHGDAWRWAVVGWSYIEARPLVEEDKSWLYARRPADMPLMTSIALERAGVHLDVPFIVG